MKRREKANYTLLVRVRLEEPLTGVRGSLEEYVAEAVRSWIGGGNPDDPLYGNIKEVTARVVNL